MGLLPRDCPRAPARVQGDGPQSAHPDPLLRKLALPGAVTCSQASATPVSVRELCDQHWGSHTCQRTPGRLRAKGAGSRGGPRGAEPSFLEFLGPEPDRCHPKKTQAQPPGARSLRTGQPGNERAAAPHGAETVLLAPSSDQLLQAVRHRVTAPSVGPREPSLRSPHLPGVSGACLVVRRRGEGLALSRLGYALIGICMDRRRDRSRIPEDRHYWALEIWPRTFALGQVLIGGAKSVGNDVSVLEAPSGSVCPVAVWTQQQRDESPTPRSSESPTPQSSGLGAGSPETPCPFAFPLPGPGSGWQSEYRHVSGGNLRGVIVALHGALVFLRRPWGQWVEGQQGNHVRWVLPRPAGGGGEKLSPPDGRAARWAQPRVLCPGPRLSVAEAARPPNTQHIPTRGPRPAPGFV